MKLSKVYNPKEVEEKIYNMWEKGGFFKPKIIKGEKPFVIVIPPPNITGSLHMGHALNSLVQDILVRKKRMEGKPALWIPGIDHAGIATQNVVEKELLKEGKTRFDLGRKNFIQRVWQWKKQYGGIIIEQLKKLGASCDWSRERFTMDKEYTKAVYRAFFHYHKKGYLYQGERVINWCPRCQTSLSDLELDYKEEKGGLWFIQYGPLAVATTRPETMLGDTAVAVHPDDKRYKKLIGKKILLPLVKREIPIIADKRVDSEFGTGAVKVTPAHDPIDFEIGKDHHLPKIKVINENGLITKEGGKYKGLDRFVAREKIIADLKKEGLLLKHKEYTHHVPHCERCGTVIEPLLSKQWFIKMEKLAKPAIDVVKKGKIKFIPEKWKKVYLDWLLEAKDWCISRQIWWGHQLPIFIGPEKNKIYIGEKPPKGYKQVEDVLDTWFSSALWPFAVLGWPKKTKDLQYFYPTSVLTTAREILFLWVARMVFSSLELTGKIPFEYVYIHPVVLTSSGKRMSKSLGTGVDPLMLIEKYGADATRFGIAWQLTGLQDLKFKEDTIISARNFCNKIWNAARFVLSQFENSKFQAKNKEPKPKTKADKTILNSLKQVIKKTNKEIEDFRFGHAAQTLYHFFWHEFCDKYIEASKAQIKTKNLQDSTLNILFYVLSTSLKLLHPFIPFITEEIWQKLPSKTQPLIVSSWPK